MKFLVDAQLPIRLARFLQASGYDTLHTRDLRSQRKPRRFISIPLDGTAGSL